MLQIARIMLIIILAFNIPEATQDNTSSIEWLLEDAFQEEHIPLSEARYVLPSEISNALIFYEKGMYRRSIEVLEKVRKLQLPDNRLDFISFLLGESYRQLRINQKALREYEFITSNFPQSDKIPPSLYRIMEFAADKERAGLADSIYQVFRKRYLKHPLYNSIVYTYGKMLYKMNRFDEAALTLIQIPKNSSRYLQAQIVSSLCYIQLKDFKKALTILDYVKLNSKNAEIASEATILTGDIYYSQSDFKKALECYKSIPEQASRYQYAVIRTAKTELDLGNYQNAKEIVKQFLKKNKSNDNYFELASILEQAYTKLGDEHNASKVDGLIQEQIVNGKLAFEVLQEIDHLVDLSKNWQNLEYEAIKTRNQQLLIQSQNAKKKIKELAQKYNALLEVLEPNSDQKMNTSVPHLAERRYLSLLKKKMISLEDSINQTKTLTFKNNPINTENRETDEKLNFFKKQYESVDHEYTLVLTECLGGQYEKSRFDEDMQTKFVDWAFMKYQDKKETLKKMAEEIAAQKKTTKSDSSQAGKILTGELTQLNYEKIDKSIIDERNKLADHIEMMQEIFKKNNNNPQILFRLAELYFDRAGDDFNAKLMVYEKRMEDSKDTAGLVFPEYNLNKVIRIYDEIIVQYPKSELADDAYYFKAMALLKESSEDSANAVLIELVDKYPESEYFVEANMNIARYYFERPKIANNTGYKLAEEAYRKVLFYRNHPQFVQALYHLGWCYYMQDKFDEAIAVFKYLVEEAKLDFDPTKMEEKQVVNPLLRGEAIDYIAISFDEEGKIEDVLKFLQLIGNDDYSALVLKRIAELREEDLDFTAAIKMYQKLLSLFPLSISAPDASIGLIKLYDSQEKRDSAIIEREKFYHLYSKGTAWNIQMAIRDSALLQKMDSIAIAMGMYVADVNFKNAENTRSQDDYLKAANGYKNVVEKYSSSKSTADARWNLAVILETKLFDRPQAFNEYRKFSQTTAFDSIRREQAALNAIAIAQSLLPADTLSAGGNLDFSAEKVVEAVNNYLKLFPNGSSFNKVLLGLGAIYFNRHMFTKAQEAYNKIVSKGPSEKEYYEALLFIGQCNFGEEKWMPAIAAFEKVWKGSESQIQQSIAYKYLLQSEFLNAKTILSKGNYEQAAVAFKTIDDKYPGSEYGDIVLFNAAEASEKKELWAKACDFYYDLVKKYPSSKLAPDALFNAAGDFEKSEKFAKAVEAYEQLVSSYPQSDKSKDALFNLGLCYEKLGKFDEMAQVNERYSAMYPGEKDVETMLLRSAAYYAKTSMFEKAINVYRNFIRRFPGSPKTVESMYMIAKCSYDSGDKENALLGFNQAEQQDLTFANSGSETNNYYASEAAYYSGMIKREKFQQVKLVLPEEDMKNAVKLKTDLLSDAAKAFQRVIQYQSDRMFEAAYRVGQLYEEFSEAYKNQERKKLDPIQAAVMEKDILNVSAQLLQKSFIPYAKSLEMSQKFDSLGTEQRSWIDKSKTSLTTNFSKAGQLQFNAIAAMNDAPIPKEIQDKPLHYYQYIKQLLETLAPLKLKVVDYYAGTINQIDSLKLSDESSKECLNQYAMVNFLIGDGYDRLASLILKRTPEISKSLSGSEKEDLLFQLEDIVYELQDKAIVEYEGALSRIERKHLSSNLWYTKIIECLARLSPDKYGASFYKTETLTSGPNWICRSDSVGNWNDRNLPKGGWKLTRKLDIKMPLGNANMMWGEKDLKHVYFWKNMFINGAPRNASVYISTKGKYSLFVNGSLTLKDTVGKKEFNIVDSATGIDALVKGGDNVIAIETTVDSSNAACLGVFFKVLIDTTKHFQTNINLPDVLNFSKIDSMRNVPAIVPSGKDSVIVRKTDTAVTNSNKNKTLSREEVLSETAKYVSKDEELSREISIEENKIQLLQKKKKEIDAAIHKVNSDIFEIRSKINLKINNEENKEKQN